MSSDDESNYSFDGEDNHYDSEEVNGVNQKKLSKLNQSCPRLCSSSRRILSKKKLRYTWPEAIGRGR
uniref:Uncharacterized protein n=1 Tax=Trichogramma kaykai TaxID=54128 RepID=A0ABD2XKZ2_9HYME